MTDFDRFDDVAEDAGLPLTPDAKERVRERLMRLNEDPVRIEVGDPEVVDFTERQFGRVIGDNGEVVRGDFEPFRPSVGRDDLFLFGSVGNQGDNNPADVFKVKKLLQRAAGTEFRPGLDGLGEADPRTVNTLRNIQGTNNLKVDGRVEPGGPTLHALGFRALGPENGRPTPLAAHEFETRFGKPADRDERGQLISVSGHDGPQLAPAAVPRDKATRRRELDAQILQLERRLIEIARNLRSAQEKYERFLEAEEELGKYNLGLLRERAARQGIQGHSAVYFFIILNLQTERRVLRSRLEKLRDMRWQLR